MNSEYEKKCKARRDALEAKAEHDEQAARELEKLKMQYDHEEELADIEASKIRAQYESQASSSSKGFWGTLGDMVLTALI